MKSAAEMISMAGRTVLVTGAASGIGQAIAVRMAMSGAHLILLDVDPAGLQTTNDRIGGGAAVHIVDLADRQQIEAFWDHLTGPVPDTLVNNAGIYPFRDFLEVDEPFWARTRATNLDSVLWMCQGFIRRRQGGGGNIVNVSSIEAILPFTRDLVPYSVTKAGVIALTRGLARDYGRHGFRVNVILPGAVRTPGTKGLTRRAIRRVNLSLVKTGYNFQQRLALGRWGDPDEVARVVLFLASDLAAYVQGAAIPVDGGFLSS